MSLTVVLLSLVCAWLLVRPHLASVSPATLAHSLELEHLNEQRGRFVQMLKDLELDLHMKRISQDDYQQMRHSLSLELAHTIEAIERGNAKKIAVPLA